MFEKKVGIWYNTLDINNDIYEVIYVSREQQTHTIEALFFF